MADKPEPKVYRFVCKDCHKAIEFQDFHQPHQEENCPNNGKIMGRVLDCDWINIVSELYKQGIIKLEGEMST